jgi:hypothetical protein
MAAARLSELGVRSKVLERKAGHEGCGMMAAAPECDLASRRCNCLLHDVRPIPAAVVAIARSSAARWRARSNARSASRSWARAASARSSVVRSTRIWPAKPAVMCTLRPALPAETCALMAALPCSTVAVMVSTLASSLASSDFAAFGIGQRAACPVVRARAPRRGWLPRCRRRSMTRASCPR